MTKQRSLDWYRSRLGMITGSAVGKIIGKGRTLGKCFTDTGLAYLHSVAAERMLPDYVVNDDELFSQYLDEVNSTTKAMQIGIEREDEAKVIFQKVTGMTVVDNTFIPSGIEGFGTSPDGLVFDKNDEFRGVLEIKCPNPQTYMQYLAKVNNAADLKAIKMEYYWQCISHMMVVKVPLCYFVVYCPYNSHPLHIVEINYDPAAADQLAGRIKNALQYINTLIPAKTK